MPKQFYFMQNFVLMLMVSPVSSFIVKLIIADFHCMLLLAAVTHSIITELA